MEIKKNSFTIYKIYYENAVVYVGRTTQPLQQGLYAHFFKMSMVQPIDIFQVEKIEYATFQTKADMYLYEVYLINLYKPKLNRDVKANDCLTIILPTINWELYVCPLMNKWKSEILKSSDLFYQHKIQEAALYQERSDIKRTIFDDPTKSREEKQNEYCIWLETYYEPTLQRLKESY